MLTEDYYAVNKLAKGYIGTANVDTNSRLCMSSAVAAHRHAFGADLVPGIYDDLTEADLLVFSGHNAAWTHPGALSPHRGQAGPEKDMHRPQAHRHRQGLRPAPDDPAADRCPAMERVCAI